MKPFVIWTIITFVFFGALSGGYHFYLQDNPRKILVAVDSSFPMKTVWPQILPLLENLSQQPYSTFSLVTEKSRVHSWSSRLQIGKTSPYAPQSLKKLIQQSYPEIKEATEKILLTNTPPSGFEDWKIITLSP